MDINKTKEYCKIATLILIVVSLGMIATNQSLEYFYRNQFLAGPCELCAELNPGIGDCFKDLKEQKEMMEQNYLFQYGTVNTAKLNQSFFINFSLAT